MNRFLSDKDKAIINTIIDQTKDGPADLLELLKNNFFLNNALLYNPKEKRISLAYPVGSNQKAHVADLWNLFSLINYLEENSYIIITPFESHDDKPLKCVWSKAWIDYKEIKGKIHLADNIIWEQGKIYENGSHTLDIVALTNECYYAKFKSWFGYIYPLKKLHELVLHDFRTVEDLRYEESIKWSRYAGRMAAAGAFVAGAGALIALAGLIIA